MSERHWIHPLRMLSQEYAKNTEIYLYNFTKHPAIAKHTHTEFDKWLPKYEEGATHREPSHGDDLAFLFGGPFATIFSDIGNDNETKFSREIVRVWVEFAKTGKPGKLWGSLKDQEWTNMEKNTKRPIFLQIVDDPKLVQASEEYENNEIKPH